MAERSADREREDTYRNKVLEDTKATRDEAEEAANLAATKDGWPKTIAFLKKNLGVK